MFRNAVLVAALGFGSLFAASGAHAANANLSAQWVSYAQRLYTQGQYDQAMRAFSAAARADSSDAAAWKGIGNCYYQKRQYNAALRYYRYAVQLSPNDSRLAAFVQRLATYAGTQSAPESDPMALGHRYYAAGQYDDAIQQYNLVTASNPNNAKAYQDLGNCYYEKSDKPDAVSAYKRSLQIDPDNTGLKAFLARYSPADAQAAGIQVASGPTDWPQPLWRSAILPGWRQFYNGDSTQGWIIGTLTIGSLIGTVATYIDGSNARSTYNSLPYGAPESRFNNAYNTWNTMATVNNVLAITFLASYTFNLVDAIMGAKPATTALGLDDETKPIQVGMLDNGTLGARVRLLDF